MYFLFLIELSITLEEMNVQRDSSELETLVWDPNNTISDKQVDQFLVVARYVERFYYIKYSKN